MLADVAFDESTRRDIDDHVAILSSRGVIGRLVGHSARKCSIRDWVQSALSPSERLQSVIPLGRGLFIMIFLSVEGAHSLVVRCPLPIQHRILFGIPWYPEFDVSSSDDRFQIPRFSVKLSFPELPAQFRVASMLQSFGFIFGFSFSSSVEVGSSVPSIRVAIPPAQVFPASISYEWEGVIRDQRLVVTGRQNECFSCLALGYLARDCPKASSRHASRRSFQR